MFVIGSLVIWSVRKHTEVVDTYNSPKLAQKVGFITKNITLSRVKAKDAKVSLGSYLCGYQNSDESQK